jgi:hypothetical protein
MPLRTGNVRMGNVIMPGTRDPAAKVVIPTKEESFPYASTTPSPRKRRSNPVNPTFLAPEEDAGA